MRHGERRPWPSDWESELTEVGHLQADHVAAELRRRGVHPDLVLSSGYVHARQTAETLSRLLGAREPVLTASALTPHSPLEGAEALRKEINEHRPGQLPETVILVAHFPRVNHLVKELVGFDVPEIAKGAAVIVDDSGSATLL